MTVLYKTVFYQDTDDTTGCLSFYILTVNFQTEVNLESCFFFDEDCKMVVLYEGQGPLGCVKTLLKDSIVSLFCQENIFLFQFIFSVHQNKLKYLQKCYWHWFSKNTV